MSNDSRNGTYEDPKTDRKKSRSFLTLGILATGSAFLGGVAVAWYYRETLKKLQNPISEANLHNSESSDIEETKVNRDGSGAVGSTIEARF